MAGNFCDYWFLSKIAFNDGRYFFSDNWMPGRNQFDGGYTPGDKSPHAVGRRRKKFNNVWDLGDLWEFFARFHRYYAH